jgi:hypothetical protein
MAVEIRNRNLAVGRFVPFAKGTAFAGANCGGEGVSLTVLPPFLCAVKEMGVNITNNNPSVFCLRQNPAPFTQGSLSYYKLNYTKKLRRAFALRSFCFYRL